MALRNEVSAAEAKIPCMRDAIRKRRLSSAWLEARHALECEPSLACHYND